jgi:hypothetical protein
MSPPNETRENRAGDAGSQEQGLNPAGRIDHPYEPAPRPFSDQDSERTVPDEPSRITGQAQAKRSRQGNQDALSMRDFLARLRFEDAGSIRRVRYHFNPSTVRPAHSRKIEAIDSLAFNRGRRTASRFGDRFFSEPGARQGMEICNSTVAYHLSRG